MMTFRMYPESTPYSAHPLRAGFITQAIRAAEWRVKEHSGHRSWKPSNQQVEEARTVQDNPAEDIGLRPFSLQEPACPPSRS